MKGDFTRDSFQPEKHYRQVLMQQGRVQVDADWNEQTAIAARRAETLTRDVVGACGGPIDGAAFRMLKSYAELTDAQYASLRRTMKSRTGVELNEDKNLAMLAAGDLLFAPGRYYIDGIQCECEEPFLYTLQPDLEPVPLASGQRYWIYLDVWLRHVTWLDDPKLREIALGGIDTATRIKTLWQIRASNSASGQCATAHQTLADLQRAALPELIARTAVTSSESEPCLLPVSAGYRGLENQLYRIEIHEDSLAVAEPTFKWSRDNGSVVTAIVDFVGDKLTVASVGPDDVLGLRVGDTVELIDDTLELQGLPGKLAIIQQIANGETIQIAPLGARPLPLPADVQLNKRAKLRRWEGVQAVALPAENDGYIKLESGIEIRFDSAGDGFRTGDYWLIPARTAAVGAESGDIDWPRALDSAGRPLKDRPLAQPPRGIAHHYCSLGFVSLDDAGAVTAIEDCRCLWPSVSAVPYLHYLSGDGQTVMPDSIVLAADPTTLFPLASPLRVAVVNHHCHGEAALVRFQVIVGQGRINVDGSFVDSADVPLDSHGEASVLFHMDGQNQVQQVQAQLLGEQGQPLPVPVTFIAHLTRAGDVAYDPSNCQTMRDNGVRTVQAAIDELCSRSHGGSGCELVVGKGGAFKRLDEALQAAIEAQLPQVCICLLPGEHVVDGPLPDLGPIDLSIHGCAGTLLQLQSLFLLQGLRSLSIERLRIDVKDTNSREAILINECESVVIESCELTWLSADSRKRALLNIVRSQRVRLANNVFSVWVPRLLQVPPVFEPFAVELNEPVLLGHPANWKMFNRVFDECRERPREVGRQVSQFIANIQDFTEEERIAYQEIVQILNPEVDLVLLRSRLERIRLAHFLRFPGVAAVLDVTEQLTLQGNNFTGDVSLYGFPVPEGDLPQNFDRWQILREAARGFNPFSMARGTLQMTSNRFSRLSVSDEMFNLVSNIDNDTLFPSIFAVAFLSDNRFDGIGNQLVVQQLNMSANAFQYPFQVVGWVVTQAAVFMGNRGPWPFDERCTLLNASAASFPIPKFQTNFQINIADQVN